MSKISNTSELQARINELKAQSTEEGLALKGTLCEIVENIHPIQLLTQGIKEFVSSTEVKNELFGLSMSMSTGYIAKKLFIGSSNNVFQRMAGNIFGVLVSKNIALNADKIQATVFSFIKGLLDGKKKNEEAMQQSDE